MFSLLSIHFFVRTGGENSLFQRYYFVRRYVFFGESSTQVHYPFFKLNYLFFAIELQKLFINLRYQPMQPVASFIHREEWKEASDSETCFQMLETFLLVDYTYTFLPNNASFYFLLSPFPLLYPISPFPSILSFFLSFPGPFYLLFLYLFFPSFCHPLIPPSFPSSNVYAISQAMTHFNAMSLSLSL